MKKLIAIVALVAFTGFIANAQTVSGDTKEKAKMEKTEKSGASCTSGKSSCCSKGSTASAKSGSSCCAPKASGNTTEAAPAERRKGKSGKSMATAEKK